MYEIWTEESLSELKKDAMKLKVDKGLIDKIISLLVVANVEHNRKMMKKDIEIAKLEGYIEGYEK